jgi:L-threonylcarbamoyladenylate synthase
MNARSVRRWCWGDPLDELEATLEAGGIVAIPTESSYALAVDPRDAAGVEAVISLKGREALKPLPVVAAGREQLEALAVRPGQPAP